MWNLCYHCSNRNRVQAKPNNSIPINLIISTSVVFARKEQNLFHRSFSKTKRKTQNQYFLHFPCVCVFRRRRGSLSWVTSFLINPSTKDQVHHLQSYWEFFDSIRCVCVFVVVVVAQPCNKNGHGSPWSKIRISKAGREEALEDGGLKNQLKSYECLKNVDTFVIIR